MFPVGWAPGTGLGSGRGGKEQVASPEEQRAGVPVGPAATCGSDGPCARYRVAFLNLRAFYVFCVSSKGTTFLTDYCAER